MLRLEVMPGKPFHPPPRRRLRRQAVDRPGLHRKGSLQRQKPDFKAGFGEYGSALIISVFEENGKIFGCEVGHAAHGKMPFSSVGNIRTSAFEVGEDRVEGETVTASEPEAFHPASGAWGRRGCTIVRVWTRLKR